MPWDDERPGRTAAPKKPEPQKDARALDRERRHAARRYFLAAPPYRIEFADDGSALLCEKRYEYWPHLTPQQATTWRTISRHRDLEDAERHLRHIVGGPIYYDETGRVVRDRPPVEPRWELPPDDDD